MLSDVQLLNHTAPRDTNTEHTNAFVSVCPMRCTFPRSMGTSTESELLHAKRGSGQMVKRVEGGILNKRRHPPSARSGRYRPLQIKTNMARALFSGARISKNKGYLQ